MKANNVNPAEGFKLGDAQELYIDLKKILLATDGSKSALSATKYAIGLAKIFRAKVATVFIDGSDRSANGNGNGHNGSRAHRGLVVARLYALKNGVPYEEKVSKGNVARKIIECAHEFMPDLIIIGNSEKSGIRRTIGSVADSVMKATDIPVLVVRST